MIYERGLKLAYLQASGWLMKTEQFYEVNL